MKPVIRQILGCLLVVFLAGCLSARDSENISAPDARQNVQTEAKHKTWTEPLTGMTFVRVSGGCYQMGQTGQGKKALIQSLGKKQYQQWFGKELPRHEVCLDGFWIGKYEVTVAQFRKFIEATNHQTAAEKRNWSYVMSSGRAKRQPDINWQQPGYDQQDSHPVVHVSWFDARCMADWLSKNSEGQYRLPTEAQWEMACRAGKNTIRFWGDTPAEACQYANGYDIALKEKKKFPWPHHPCTDGYATTAPVGSFQPNAMGLHDMLGNVSEWCRDVFDKKAYRHHSRTNPFYKQGEGTRVVRGGGWYSAPHSMRCSVRRGNCPMNTDDALGFRLIRLD